MDKFYTVDDLAGILNVPKSTIYYWRTQRKKNFPEGVKVGKHLHWDKVTFDQWFQEQAEPTNLADTIGNVFTAMTTVTTAIAQDTDLRQPLQDVKVAVDNAIKSL